MPSINFKSDLKNESGLVVVITAVFAGVLITLLIAFVIDRNFVARERARLQSDTDSLCSNAANRLPFTAIARLLYYNQLQTIIGNLNPRVTITEASIVAPTNPQPATNLAYQYPLQVFQPTRVFSSNLCGFIAGASCQLFYNVDRPSGFITGSQGWTTPPDGVFPPMGSGFWANSTHFGSVLGCTQTRNVATFISGQRTIRAKAAYQMVQEQADTRNNRNGVIIGIDPTAISLSTDPRFRFAGPTFTQNGIDPLQGAPIGTTNCSPALNVNNFGFVSPSAEETGYTCATARREELLVGAMNPHIAVRNRIASGLAARFMRMATTRANTAIWLTGIKQFGDINLIAPTPIISQLPPQQDSANRSYQLNRLAAGGGVNTQPNSGVASVSDYFLYAFHLYHIPIRGGLSPFVDPSAFNINFEPFAMTPFSAPTVSLPTGNDTPPTPAYWGPQPEPAQINRYFFNAEEAVSVLGSVQASPDNIGPKPNAITGSPFNSYNTLAGDNIPLVGDFVQLLRTIRISYPNTHPLANAPIVLILTNPIAQSDQAALINELTLLDALPPTPDALRRPVYVIYIPTNLSDCQLYQTYRGNGWFSNPNRFRVVAPNAGPGAACQCPDITATEDECFRDYWQTALLAGTGYTGEVLSNSAQEVIEAILDQGWPIVNKL